MMNLDLNICLPESTQDWKIEDKFVYFHKVIDIPIMVYKDDILWIILDFKAKGQISKLIKHLTKKGIKFLFINHSIVHHKKIYREDLNKIIDSYLLALIDEDFYKKLIELKFDYVSNLTEFILTYDCYNEFLVIWKEYRSINLSKYITPRESFRRVENAEIRNSILNIDRMIKLNLVIDF